jgi:hypothetical protein
MPNVSSIKPVVRSAIANGTVFCGELCSLLRIMASLPQD